MSLMKGQWVRPSLVVVVRGRSEEAVLAACKNWPAQGKGNVNITACGIADCTMCYEWYVGS